MFTAFPGFTADDTYRILQELAFNMELYKTSKRNIIKQVFGKLYKVSRTSFVQSLYQNDIEHKYHMTF